MIEVIWPEAALIEESPQMAVVLKPAVMRDAKRSWFDVSRRLENGTFQAWRAPGGYLVTEFYERGPFWIIYAAGKGGTLRQMKALLSEVEGEAKKAGCHSVKFDNRDWRRIAQGYDATRDDDGIWHFEKVL